jgi:hypothetical protein
MLTRGCAGSRSAEEPSIQGVFSCCASSHVWLLEAIFGEAQNGYMARTGLSGVDAHDPRCSADHDDSDLRKQFLLWLQVCDASSCTDILTQVL